MISNITINGIVYELIDNPDKTNMSCDKCDLVLFCGMHNSFIRTCTETNNNNYYKGIKQ